MYFTVNPKSITWTLLKFEGQNVHGAITNPTSIAAELSIDACVTALHISSHICGTNTSLDIGKK